MSKYLADPMHGGFINFSEEKLEAWRAALFHAREVYFMWHLAEQHWVLVRLNKATKLCEIYEPSCLVKDKVIAQTIFDAMNRLFDTDEYDEWCSVLYNSKAARIPRQHDGCSCGVFMCVIARHLIFDCALPKQLLAEALLEWRSHIAMTLSMARLQV